tara:strand:- start:25 stop:711 length:687 start_codon:yes stop_codon:yes gene_type:complete
MKNKNINTDYSRFYAERTHSHVYPTEFVVRTFLGEYQNLNFKKPKPNETILDVAFGDGRNTKFLCELGLKVYGVEISESIIDQTRKRLNNLGHKPILNQERNSSMPFKDEMFDYILACHCCYYCDEGETIYNNLEEYKRILKPGGVLITSVADLNSYIFKDAEKMLDGTMLIKNDPYNNRNDYRLHGFSSKEKIENYFSTFFKNFSFGTDINNYYGDDERLFWIVCEK